MSLAQNTTATLSKLENLITLMFLGLKCMYISTNKEYDFKIPIITVFLDLPPKGP